MSQRQSYHVPITKTFLIFSCSRIKNLIIPFASHTHSRGQTLLIPQTVSQPFLILISRTERTILSAWSTLFTPIYSPFTWPHTDSYCFLAFFLQQSEQTTLYNSLFCYLLPHPFNFVSSVNFMWNNFLSSFTSSDKNVK